MRSSKFLTVLLLSVALSACKMTYSVSNSISIPGAQPDYIKLEIAKDVAFRVWNGDLKSKLKTKIPELKDKNLDTLLDIRWVKSINTNVNNVTSISSNVFVKCVFKSELSLAIGQKAVAICIDSVKQEIIDVNTPDAI